MVLVRRGIRQVDLPWVWLAVDVGCLLVVGSWLAVDGLVVGEKGLFGGGWKWLAVNRGWLAVDRAGWQWMGLVVGGWGLVGD